MDNELTVGELKNYMFASGRGSAFAETELKLTEIDTKFLSFCEEHGIVKVTGIDEDGIKVGFEIAVRYSDGAATVIGPQD